jgi:hypothetical protein
VRLRGLVEGEDVRDPGAQGAGFDEAEGFVELALRSGVGAQDFELLDDDEAGVQVHDPGLEIADGDQAAAGGEGLQGLAKVRLPTM